MVKYVKWVFVFVSWMVCCNLSSSDSSTILSELQSLIGQWEGTYQWSGARSDHGKISAIYSRTGNGSAVVEDLRIEDETIMTSVYHADGKDLRMTHFCAAANQPRLKAYSYKENPRTIQFELIDVTNLSAADAPHVAGVKLVLQNENSIVLSFTFVGKNQTSIERIELHRTR